jgi:hypothetical protein
MVSCVDSLPVCRHETSYQKNPHRLFMIPARTSLRSHAPAFMSPTCGISHSWSMLRMCQRTPRTSLRSHSPCHSHVFFFFLCFFFLFVCLKDIGKHFSRDRVITLLVILPLRGFSPPVPGSIFAVFFRVLLRVDFSSLFDLSTTFIVIYIIINTSLTSSYHQNLLSTHHEIVKTRQHAKNGQK